MPARQSSNQRAVARRAILLLEGASAQCSSMQTRCPRDLSCHADAAPRREAPMTDYTYDFVNVRVGDGIAWAALNRPEKRNAMSPAQAMPDRKSTRLNSSHLGISYAVFCLKKKKMKKEYK